MRKIMKRIMAWTLSLSMIIAMAPMTGTTMRVLAEDNANFLTNGGFEETAWYHMPKGWETNLGYIYDNYDGDRHYTTLSGTNNASSIQEGIGVSGTKGAYYKSEDNTVAYSTSYKDGRGYVAISSSDVTYNYLLGFDYRTTTGVTSTDIGLFFRTFIHHKIANTPYKVAVTGNIPVTQEYMTFSATTARNNVNTPNNPVALDVGIRNATVGNEIYMDNVYCVPDVLKPSDTSDTALQVLANAEWYQEVELSQNAREYFLNARMAGPDAVIEVQQYNDSEALGEVITIASKSLSNSSFVAIEQQAITVDEAATKIKVTLKNIADSIAISYFDDIELTSEGEVPLGITPVSLRNFFRENMVLQRNKPHTFWGNGEPGETYTVTLSDDENSSTVQTTIGEDGTWKVALKSLPAQEEPYTLTIAHETKPDIKKINKVYVGDVFLLAGQSNMAYSKNYHGTSMEVLVNSNIKYIVLDDISSNSITADIPLQSGFSQWAELSENNKDGLSKELSILGMYFADYLSKTQQDVPIGLINAPWGGTEIVKWIKGGNIYNNHIAPLSGYNLAGILWYQGCQDGSASIRTSKYADRFAHMIDHYRELFEDDDLPFMYVQLARYSTGTYFGELRSLQTETLDLVKEPSNMAMITSLDTDKGIGPGNVHPLGKEILAERFANSFKKMRNDADAPTVVSGPLIEKAELDNTNSEEVILSFEEGTAEGLKIKNPDYSAAQDGSGCSSATSLQEFEIAGADKNFVDATAVIDGKNIRVSADSIKKPAYVRYATDSAPDNPNLANAAGLPAPAFLIKVTGADISPKAAGNQKSDATEDGLLFDQRDNGDGTCTVTLKPKAWTDGSTTNYAEVYVNESDGNNHYSESNLIVGRKRLTFINFALSDFFKNKEITNISLTLKKYNGHAGGNRKLIVKKIYDNTWASSLETIQTITSKNIALDRHLDYEVFTGEMKLAGVEDKELDLTASLKDNLGDMNELSLELSTEEVIGDASEEGANLAKGESTLSITYRTNNVEETELKGDLNGDKKITSIDALMALRLVVSDKEITDEQKKITDVDNDGNLTTNDVIRILQYASGEIK